VAAAPESLPAGGALAGNGAGTFAMLNLGGVEYAYIPNGSYIEDPNAVLNPDVNTPTIGGVTYTGVSVVPLSTTSGTKTQISTPDALNSCAANQTTGIVVCTSNNTDIYIIASATNTITATLQSGGNVSFPFYSSGGACVTCGVTVNSANNTAIIGVSADPTANAGMSGYQILNLANNTLSQVFYVTGNHIAEAWSVDTDHNLLLSPTEDIGQIETSSTDSGYGPVNLIQPTQFELFDLSPSTPAQYDFSPASATPSLFAVGTDLDTVAQDVTGITIATQEYSGNLLLSDLSQKTTTSGNPGSWNAPSQLLNLPELGPSNGLSVSMPLGTDGNFFTNGASALQIATGAHYGFLEDEFGAGAIGAIILPSSSTPGSAPGLFDYVLAAMPNDPATQAPWQNPLEPHGLAAAYASIGGDDAYGILMNTTFNTAAALSSPASANGISSLPYSRSSVAVVSLAGLIAAPRVSGCTQNSIAIASLTESGSTVTVTTASPHGFSVGQIVSIGELFNGYVEDPSGSLSYNGSFTITAVPDAATTDITFTYTNPVTGLGDATAGTGLFVSANATTSVCTPDFSGHFVDPSYDLVGNGVIRFFPVH